MAFSRHLRTGQTFSVAAPFVVALVLLCLAPGAYSDDRPRVVTTFTVLADMAQRVAGDAAEVVSVTKPGAEIHNYQPTPRDIGRARNADLVIRNGMGLELWFEKFLTRLDGVPSVTASDGVAPIAIGSGPYDGKPNPHAWMSPVSAAVYVDNIRDALISIAPDASDTITANADAYKQELAATLDPLVALIETVPETSRWLVSSEGAFSYLARDLGLKELFLWPINADAQGTPQQVRRVIDTVKAESIPVVFSESTVSSKPAEQVARETGARYGGALYVDSLSAPDGPVPTYLDLLRVTVETLVKGLTHDSSPDAG